MDYDFENSEQDVSKIGHFSQLVWKSSEKLGVGIAISESGKAYVVCNYEPGGNILGQFLTNVSAPLEKPVSKKNIKLPDD